MVLSKNGPTTESHTLATENADVGTPRDTSAAGEADVENADVQNFRWRERNLEPRPPVRHGVPSEQLSTLIRRFDNQTFHVQSVSMPPLANLDMNMAENQEFSPEKLRAQLERLYTSVIVQLAEFWRRVAQLRSWSDWRQTSAFLSVYAAAWATDLLLSTMIAFLIVLILSPASRRICFPPLSPEHRHTGKGKTSEKNSRSSAAGGPGIVTPEGEPGDGAEREAHSFLNSIATLLLSTSAGEKDQNTGRTSRHKEENDIPAPDIVQLQTDIICAKDKPTDQDAAHQKSSKPVSQIVWTGAEKSMNVIALFVDNWERVGNALSPTPPFSGARPKVLIALCLSVPLLGSWFVTSYVIAKVLGLVVGVALFGAPVLSRIDAMFIRNYPRFRKVLAPKNSILRGVPTNAQLAITLLRMGEHSKAPVPSPAQMNSPSRNTNNKQNNSESDGETGQSSIANRKQAKRGGFLGFLRAVTGGGINIFLGTDRIKAAVGDQNAKDRLGVVQPPDTNAFAGPVRFPARYQGQKGYAYVTTTATSPALSWTSDLDNVDPAWTIAIADIEGLEKIGGLGWKSKIVVHWALEKDVLDGLLVKSTSEEYHLTAITMRDELFDRLVSAGPQIWEAI